MVVTVLVQGGLKTHNSQLKRQKSVETHLSLTLMRVKLVFKIFAFFTYLSDFWKKHSPLPCGWRRPSFPENWPLRWCRSIQSPFRWKTFRLWLCRARLQGLRRGRQHRRSLSAGKQEGSWNPTPVTCQCSWKKYIECVRIGYFILNVRQGLSKLTTSN